MGFLGAIKSAAGKVARVVTYPVVKPTEIIMTAAIKAALLSLLKGLAATAIAALSAFAATPTSDANAITVGIWGLLINGVHALITLIQHSTATPAK